MFGYGMTPNSAHIQQQQVNFGQLVTNHQTQNRGDSQFRANDFSSSHGSDHSSNLTVNHGQDRQTTWYDSSMVQFNEAFLDNSRHTPPPAEKTA